MQIDEWRKLFDQIYRWVSPVVFVLDVLIFLMIIVLLSSLTFWMLNLISLP